MPCFLNDRSSSVDTASSSTGTMRGSSSMMVTSLPKRRKIEANSTPTAPLPRMTIDLGISLRPIASSLVMIRLRSISMPGTLRGCEPVATMISFRAVSVCCLAAGDLDRALAGQPGAALDPVDLVLLEEQLDAAGQPLDDLVLAGLHLGHVEADGRLTDRQPPVLPVLRDLERVRVLEERLGRDAAPVEAGAAEHRRALDHRGAKPELRRADGGDVAARPRPDDHDDRIRSPLLVFLSHRGKRDEGDGRGRRAGSAGSALVVSASGSSRASRDLSRVYS